MDEQSKATNRRLGLGRFANRWFVGRGLDVGCGPDPLRKDEWPRVTEIVPYDQELGHKDAQFLPELKDGEFDFVHSSHCLEHLPNTRSALTNWSRVLKPGGYIICTIPDEVLYEGGRWPSHFNPDHKVSFTLRSMPVIPGSLNILSVLWKLNFDVERVELLTDGWDPLLLGTDQTLGRAECAIEFVARKPGKNPW